MMRLFTQQRLILIILATILSLSLFYKGRQVAKWYQGTRTGDSDFHKFLKKAHSEIPEDATVFLVGGTGRHALHSAKRLYPRKIHLCNTYEEAAIGVRGQPDFWIVDLRSGFDGGAAKILRADDLR